MDEAGLRFQTYSARKTQEATAAAIRPLAALGEGPLARELHGIGTTAKQSRGHADPERERPIAEA